MHRALNRPERDVVTDAGRYLQSALPLDEPVQTARSWRQAGSGHRSGTASFAEKLAAGNDRERTRDQRRTPRIVRRQRWAGAGRTARADGFANCRESDNGSPSKGAALAVRRRSLNAAAASTVESRSILRTAGAAYDHCLNGRIEVTTKPRCHAGQLRGHPLYTRPVDRDLAVIEDAKSSKMCGSRFF